MTQYKPSKEVMKLLKEAHQLLEVDVIEAIVKLIEAMKLIRKEAGL